MKNSTFKALIVFLAAVTVLSGCGGSKSNKKSPIVIKNQTNQAVATNGTTVPTQTVSDLSDMDPVEPVEKVGRPSANKDQSARGKNTPAASSGQTSTKSEGGSSNGATVKRIADGGTTAAPTTAAPKRQAPATQTSSVTKPETNKPAVSAVVNGPSISVSLIASEDLENKETLVSREIITKIGSLVSRVSSANRAVPVSDDYYEQRVLSSNDNPYITSTVYNTLVETGACDLGVTRGCVAFEKDTRSGQTKTRAYLLGVQTNSFNSGAARVLRAEVNDKALSADITEVLKSKANGIYIYPVTWEVQAAPAPVAAPKRSTPATTQTKPAPQVKPEVKPETKAAVKTETKSEVKAPEVKKPTTTQATKESKTQEVQAEVVKRQLGVQLVYIDEAQSNENKEAHASLSDMWSKSDLVKAKALKASPVSDEAYETRLPSTPQNPKVSVSTFTQLLSTGACDLNLVGACVVLEKDVIANKERTAAYYLGSAPQNNWNLVGNINVARRDISDKSLLAKAAQILKNKNSGIYVYSLATKGQNVLAEQNDTVAAGEAEKDIKQADSLTPAQVESQITVVTDESEKAKAQKAIDDAVAKSTTKTANYGHFNFCAVTSVRNEQFPKRGLKTVRRIFILDFVNVASMLSGKEELPLKIGKGVLYCKLYDGRIQKVNIQITEYVSPFTVGLVLSKTNQNLVASGVGFANGALDILKERDFGALVEVDAMALVGGFSVAPIILSGTGKGTPFILAGQISVAPQWMFLNVRATFGARYEIIVDPDDT